ncbi:MAG TPA: hypothetical protein DCP98_08555 [Sphaerochaeta sp.]|jgi:predicted permease|nr:hypothetical protein [Sphaerochaeta sp.]
MEVIKISAIAIAPIMFFMALGYFFQKKSILSRPAAKELNIIVFKFFLSTMCGETLYKADLNRDVELLPILIVACGLVGTFLLLCLIVPRFVKEKDQIPVMIQGIYKSNYALLGIPIAQSICGADRIGITAVVAIVILPLNNIFSAFIFEKYTGKATSIPKLLLKIITNPLVLACIIGLGLNLSGLQIPSWIMTGIISKLSSLATPLSMIALGATFEFGFIKKYGKKIFWAVFAKLILIPSVIIPVSILLGLRGPSLVAVAIYAAAPNAVNSYSTAVAMGGDADLANEIVVMSSIISMVTLFGWFVLIGNVVGF